MLAPVVGLILATATVAAVLWWESGPALPAEPAVQVELVVHDAATGKALEGVEIIHEYETGEFEPDFPRVGATDIQGIVVVTCGFVKPELRGVGPHERRTLLQLAEARHGGDRFACRKPTYREASVRWSDIYAMLLDHRGAARLVIPVDLKAR